MTAVLTLLDLGNDLVGVGLGDVVDDNLGLALGVHVGVGATEATASAGDDDDEVLEVEGHGDCSGRKNGWEGRSRVVRWCYKSMPQSGGHTRLDGEEVWRRAKLVQFPEIFRAPLR